MQLLGFLSLPLPVIGGARRLRGPSLSRMLRWAVLVAWSTAILGIVPEVEAQEVEADSSAGGVSPIPPTARGTTREARALRLGHAGLLAFRSEHFTEALSLFQEAENLAHSPVFLLYQSRAARELGRMVQARRLLRRCAQEPLTSESPNAWLRAQAESTGELAALEFHIPQLRLTLRGAVTPPIEVTELQGMEMDVEASEGDRQFVLWTNPGHHEVLLEDAAGRRRELSWDTRSTPGEGARLAISTVLTSEDDVSTTPSQPQAPHHREPSRLRRGAWAAVASGGVLFAAGLVSGGIAIERATTLKSRCQAGVCSPEDERLRDQALRAARLASVGVVAGGLGMLGGGALFVVDRRQRRRWSVALAPVSLSLRLDY